MLQETPSVPLTIAYLAVATLIASPLSTHGWAAANPLEDASTTEGTAALQPSEGGDQDGLGIEIITPRDGETFETSEGIQVAGTASGNVSMINVTVDDEEIQVEDKEKWHTRWNGSEEEGTFLITAQVTDEENRTANDSVNIDIKEDEADPAIDPDPDPDPEPEDDADAPALTTVGLFAAITVAAFLRPQR